MNKLAVILFLVYIAITFFIIYLEETGSMSKELAELSFLVSLLVFGSAIGLVPEKVED